MANIAISALPDAGDIQAGDTIPIVRAGTTMRSTSDPTVSASSMVGQAGDVIVVNPAEDGFDFNAFPDWAVELRAGSVVAQNPSGLDTALQVEFGAAQALTNVSLSATGDITFNTAGTYQVTAIFTFGRTTSPGVAMMFLRATFNGAPLGAVIAISMAGSDVVVPVAFSNIFAVSATDVLGIEIIRDSSGQDNGGLLTVNPIAAGWVDSSSSTLVVSRIV